MVWFPSRFFGRLSVLSARARLHPRTGPPIWLCWGKIRHLGKNSKGISGLINFEMPDTIGRIIQVSQVPKGAVFLESPFTIRIIQEPKQGKAVGFKQVFGNYL
jgi:hypothetical protein